ncbi:tyrosine-type recombinase/integrase [Jatrophihabitans sp. YIM 134969]
MPSPRQPNGRSSIYKDGDGGWHGRVTMGVRSDGRVDRRHLRGKTKAEVATKVRELEKHREAGTKTEAGRAPTLETWLRRWLDTIARPRIKPKSYASYESDLRAHLIPHLGGHRIDRLQTEHIETMFAAMTRAGSSAGTVQHVKRTLNAALNEAVGRGMIGRNPVTRASTPRPTNEEIEPLTTDEARTVLEAASHEVNGAAWTLALCLGLRRGEVLALHWVDVDLEQGTITVRRSMGRLPWRHGCSDPVVCTKSHHRPSCKRGCTLHAVRCPEKHGGGIVFDTPKSRAGRRTVTMPQTLIGVLRSHKAQQAERQLAAGKDWEPFGLVFTNDTGYPLDPDAHSKDWKRLLASCGVRPARLHDARHSAATYLLVQGVDSRTVMDMMGWSQLSMTQRYQHVVPELKREAAARMDSLLWGDNSSRPG